MFQYLVSFYLIIVAAYLLYKITIYVHKYTEKLQVYKKKSILFEFNYGYKVNIVYQFFFYEKREDDQ